MIARVSLVDYQPRSAVSDDRTSSLLLYRYQRFLLYSLDGSWVGKRWYQRVGVASAMLGPSSWLYSDPWSADECIVLFNSFGYCLHIIWSFIFFKNTASSYLIVYYGVLLCSKLQQQINQRMRIEFSQVSNPFLFQCSSVFCSSMYDHMISNDARAIVEVDRSMFYIWRM